MYLRGFVRAEIKRLWHLRMIYVVWGVFLVALGFSVSAAKERLSQLGMASQEEIAGISRLTEKTVSRSMGDVCSCELHYDRFAIIEPGFLFEVIPILNGRPLRNMDVSSTRLVNSASSLEGQLSPWRLLVIFFPLVIFTMTYNMFSQDWERGMMTHILAQPVTFYSFYFVRVLTRVISCLILTVVTILLTFSLAGLGIGDVTSERGMIMGAISPGVGGKRFADRLTRTFTSPCLTPYQSINGNPFM